MGHGFVVLGFALLVLAHAFSPALAAERAVGHAPDDQPGLARFEGGWIDLKSGWGLARACLVVSSGSIECFRSTSELRRREAAVLVPGVDCSVSLRLYDGTGRTGQMVSVYARGVWVNLSTLSFDNKTSSYAVGACAAEMASGAGGGGSLYSGCLSPWCVANSMGTGWNNAVSSVYLY
jgi:hypothetical protein